MMTAADFEYMRGYFRELGRRLGLGHWRIEVDDDPLQQGQDAHAETTVFAESYVSRHRLAHDWREQSAEQQRETALHELLHVHFDGPARVLDEDVRPELSRSTFEVAQRTQMREVERTVDVLARALAPLFPLPAWPGGEA